MSSVIDLQSPSGEIITAVAITLQTLGSTPTYVEEVEVFCGEAGVEATQPVAAFGESSRNDNVRRVMRSARGFKSINVATANHRVVAVSIEPVLPIASESKDEGGFFSNLFSRGQETRSRARALVEGGSSSINRNVVGSLDPGRLFRSFDTDVPTLTQRSCHGQASGPIRSIRVTTDPSGHITDLLGSSLYSSRESLTDRNHCHHDDDEVYESCCESWMGDQDPCLFAAKLIVAVIFIILLLLLMVILLRKDRIGNMVTHPAPPPPYRPSVSDMVPKAPMWDVGASPGDSVTWS